MGSFPPATVFTPISLPDGAFTHARQSPVPKNDSQEYQFGVDASVPPHGLGATAPFPALFPPAMVSSLKYTPEDVDYAIAENTQPSQPAPASRSRAAVRRTTPVRGAPVTILPHPEGLQRLEQQRQQSHIGPQLRQQLPPTGRSRKQREAEDDFVNRLRDQDVSWKTISQMFSHEFNKPSTPAQLQMRRTRQRERVTRWDENDVSMCVVPASPGSRRIGLTVTLGIDTAANPGARSIRAG